MANNGENDDCNDESTVNAIRNYLNQIKLLYDSLSDDGKEQTFKDECVRCGMNIIEPNSSTCAVALSWGALKVHTKNEVKHFNEFQ